MVGMRRRRPLRLVPPAGHPVGARQILKAAFLASREGTGWFREELKLYTRADYCFLVSSGTAALYLILKSIARSDGRDEVIVPAYSCPSLVAAALKAGLKVRLCDIRPNGFGLDLDSLTSLLTRKTLCVVAVHLFGIPDDIQSIKDAVADEGVILVEDSAQAFGIEIDGVKLGTKGDIGFYSFGRGKTLTLLGGGAIVTNRADLAVTVEKHVRKLPPDRLFGNLTALGETMLYSLFVHPRLYWIPSSFRFLRLGETYFVEDFAVGRLRRFHAALARVFLRLTDVMARERMEKSRSVVEALSHLAEDSLLFIPGADRSIPYLRLPVVLGSRGTRDMVINGLLRKGIGATAMYRAPLQRIEGVSRSLLGDQDCAHAEELSSRLLTIPVNPFMTVDDVSDVAEVFRDALSQARRG